MLFFNKQPHKNPKIKLIVGLLSKDIEKFSSVKEILAKKFGPIDLESPVWDFSKTHYYDDELGTPIKRKFLSFAQLIDDISLYKVKNYTRSIERIFMENQKRGINIDPGYVNYSKLVLFTTKDYSHRIYLGCGIYGEVTLKYEKNSFSPWPWTYPDYASGSHVEFFNNVRRLYDQAQKAQK